MKTLQFLLVIAVIGIGVALADNAEQKQIRRTRRPIRPAVSKENTATAHPLEDTDSARAKRSHDKWLEIISQFARRGGEGGANSPWAPFPIDLPIAGKDGKTTTLPVLILPLPVPVAGPKEECSANHNNQNADRYAPANDRFRDENNKFKEDQYREDNDRYRGDNGRYRGDNERDRVDNGRYRGDNGRYRGDNDRFRGDNDRYSGDGYRYKEDNNRYREGNNRNREDNTRSRGDEKNKEVMFNFKDENKSNKIINKSGIEVRIGVQDDGFASFDKGTVSSDNLTELFQKQRPKNPELPPSVFNHYEPPIIHPSLPEDRQYLPPAQETVSSDYLIELFQKQQPRNPELPPSVFNKYAPPIIHPSLPEDRQYLPPAQEVIPTPPRFNRSIKVRGFLTPYRSDYTEEYTAWYDASTGSTRMEYHEGKATSYRTMTPDGFVERLMTHTDRSGEQDVRMCAVTSRSQATPEDRSPPVLPNAADFTFGGYREEFGGRVEVWLKEMKGRAGELGASKGEELTYHHELIVSKAGGGDFAVPLRYKVSIDSSFLGQDIDGYEHVYSEVVEQEHSPDIFSFNPDQQCEQQDQMDPNNPDDMARLEPIREFTMPTRDKRYGANFDRFAKEFERNYSDDKETALRRTLLMQKNRFISSCNRQSGSFSVGVNFLSDRLDAEIDILLGASYSAEVEKSALPFPLSDGRIKTLESSLPKEFDWRPLGGVTPVKFQGAACSSCWAFAVVGAVEGALFIRTSKLVELSEQALVDCGHSHKANGCNGTWPAAAFNYVKERGLPARDEYTPYMEKKLECKAPPVPSVTHISGHADVPPNNINALKVAIRRFAPTVVVVDAHCNTFVHYTKGVLHDDRCIKGPKKKLNHAVLSVGWGELKSETHFIIKNSWHEKWGEGGYIRLHAPSNTCGHLTTPNYPRLRRADVDRLPSDAKKVDEEVSGDNERR